MSNSVALTKRVNHTELSMELTAAGVTTVSAITSTHIRCGGAAWEAMDQTARDAQLALVGSTVASHQPTTVTEVALSARPHERTFFAECSAVPGISGISIEHPAAYPGTAAILHNSLDADRRSTLTQIALAHDPTAATALSVSTSSVVVCPPDGSSTRTVTVTDSRGAGASGKTVRLRVFGSVAVPVDGDSFVLDGAGQAVATFGPSSSITGEIGLEFYYETGEADTASFRVRFGTP